MKKLLLLGLIPFVLVMGQTTVRDQQLKSSLWPGLWYSDTTGRLTFIQLSSDFVIIKNADGTLSLRTAALAASTPQVITVFSTEGQRIYNITTTSVVSAVEVIRNGIIQNDITASGGSPAADYTISADKKTITFANGELSSPRAGDIIKIKYWIN